MKTIIIASLLIGSALYAGAPSDVKVFDFKYFIILKGRLEPIPQNEAEHYLTTKERRVYQCGEVRR